MNQGYRELQVWHKAMDLVVNVYDVTTLSPREERFGLTAQMRSAAVSVPANIAEGNGRATTGEHLNSLSVSRGSLNELDTLAEIASRLHLASPERIHLLNEGHSEVGRMLLGLRRSIERKGLRQR